MESGCNGLRDRTEYVGISKFTEKNLRNDYHFLEDVLQTKGTAKRTLIHINNDDRSNLNDLKKKNIKQTINPFENIDIKNITTTSNFQNLQSYRASAKRLVKAARKRGISMILFSPGMLKRQLNTTQYNPKVDAIFWRIHVVFIVNEMFDISSLLKPDIESKGEQEMNIADGSLMSVTINTIDENKTIDDILNLYFEVRPGNSVQRHALRPLRLKQDNIRCFMHKIPSPANAPLFQDINRHDTINNALKGKTIIEYPTIFVGASEDISKLRFLVEEECTITSMTDSTIVTNMKRPVEEIHDNDAMGSKRIRFDDHIKVNDYDDENDDDENEDDASIDYENTNHMTNDDDNDDNDEEEEEFLKSLNEFANKDINALREFIASAE